MTDFEVKLYEVTQKGAATRDTMTAETDSKSDAIAKAQAWAKKEAGGREDLRVSIRYAGVLVADYKLDSL
ncbi:hypothetical protein CWO91_13990 [Bradyrhizobium genosp. SA-3]|uniref:hypothetical protein n=1 Tax=Bradyrhizobium genosp. SA-3 TaxID=508868 RepID=UPI00102A5751|nr:hypothetical protein [Bradyrhizobium genosp. SA-3]RZN10299.1 hypothetical protein CWO91_13990 [Bradyrhizobium genosp. SA-3]